MPPRKKPVRRKKAAASVGLTAAETKTAHGAEIDRLTARVEADGGAVLAAYNDPFGGKPSAGFPGCGGKRPGGGRMRERPGWRPG